MNLPEIAGLLAAEVLCGEGLDKVEIRSACASDLMSDLLCAGRSRSRSILLTGLTNPQVVRTAEMSEISAVCFVRGKRPPSETIELAVKSGIPLLLSSASMYTACGRLHMAGLEDSP